MHAHGIGEGDLVSSSSTDHFAKLSGSEPLMFSTPPFGLSKAASTVTHGTAKIDTCRFHSQFPGR